MKRKSFVLGVLAFLFIFGLIFGGCTPSYDTVNGDDDGLILPPSGEGKGRMTIQFLPNQFQANVWDIGWAVTDVLSGQNVVLEYSGPTSVNLGIAPKDTGEGQIPYPFAPSVQILPLSVGKHWLVLTPWKEWWTDQALDRTKPSDRDLARARLLPQIRVVKVTR